MDFIWFLDNIQTYLNIFFNGNNVFLSLIKVIGLLLKKTATRLLFVNFICI